MAGYAAAGLQIDKSIIGWDSTVGAWCRLENHCVLGEDVQVKVRVRGLQEALTVSSYHQQTSSLFTSICCCC